MPKPTKQSYNRTMTAFRETDMYPKLKEYCSVHSLRLNETLLEAISSWKPYSKWAKNKYPSKKTPPPNEGLREYCKENGMKQNFVMAKAVEEFIRQ